MGRWRSARKALSDLAAACWACRQTWFQSPRPLAASAMATSSAAKAAHLFSALIGHGSLVNDFVQHEDPPLVHQAVQLLRRVDQDIQADLWADQPEYFLGSLQQRLVGLFDHDQIEIAPFVDVPLGHRSEEDQFLGRVLTDQDLGHPVELLLEAEGALLNSGMHAPMPLSRRAGRGRWRLSARR